MHSRTVMVQHIELRRIEELVPYEKNPRTHSARQVDQIKASMKEFGFVVPILIDSKAGIVAGHGRLLAARKLGLTHVPVIVLDHLSEAQKRAYLLADNQLALNAGWDEDLLRVELEELKALDINIDLIGFDPGDLDRMLARGRGSCLVDEDKVPEAPRQVTSARGDLWILGGHRLVCGDATDAGDVARLCGSAGERAQPLLLVTDPPYGIELDSEWRDRAGLNACGKAEPSYMKKRTEGHTETTISGDTRADWSAAFELVPSLQVAYVWHASKYTREVLDGLLRIGFVHHQQIIWNKGRAVLTRTHYWFQHEPCWYVRKKNAPWYGKAGENTTIWDSPSPKFIMGGSKEDKYDHPTQKPVELMKKAILNHTREGEVVYDPFLGSGTTLAAAESTKRLCYGVELDPKYVDVIVMRWQNLTGKEATLDGDARTFRQVGASRYPMAA